MNSSKIRVNTSLTVNVLAEVDKLIAEAVHGENRPTTYEEIKTYYDRAVDSVIPDGKVDFLTLDWGMLKEHMLGYIEELSPTEFGRIRVYNREGDSDTVFTEEVKGVNPLPEDPVVTDEEEMSSFDISYTDIKRDELLCTVRRKSPKTFLDLINLYDAEMGDLSDECLDNIDFSVIMHDIVDYATDNFAGHPDYNIYYLNENSVMKDRGYDYFLEFRDDVRNAYSDDNNWFYGYICEGCGQWVYMKRGEVRYYHDKHLKMPKRCKNCRNNRSKKLKKED